MVSYNEEQGRNRYEIRDAPDHSNSERVLKCPECGRVASVAPWVKRPVCVHAWDAGSPEITDGDDSDGNGRPIEWAPNEAFRTPGPDTWAEMVPFAPVSDQSEDCICGSETWPHPYCPEHGHDQSDDGIQRLTGVGNAKGGPCWSDGEGGAAEAEGHPATAGMSPDSVASADGPSLAAEVERLREALTNLLEVSRPYLVTGRNSPVPEWSDARAALDGEAE